MAGRRSKLTPEVLNKVVAYIRAGSFAWVAAEAAGISKATHFRWMKRGEEAKRGLHHDYYEAVREAMAQARVAAEISVREQNPLSWLRFGPGRSRPGEPGWTESHELTGPDAGPVLFTLALASDESEGGTDA